MNRKLTDQAILETAVALRASAPVTGRRLRRALAERYGARGDVARVYRLLHLVEPATGEGSANGSRAEQDTALAAMAERLDVAERERMAAVAAAEQAAERARLAEHREQVHQDKWAIEVDRLRTELKASRLSAPSPEGASENRRLKALLAVSERRVTQLEERLIALEREAATLGPMR